MSNLISVFKGVRDCKSHSEMEILEALSRIKEGVNKGIVLKAREAYGTPEYDVNKSVLPTYKFSGLFSGPSDSSVTAHTGFICLDFDKFKTQEDLEEGRKKLEASEYTYANFLSPSGMGFKTIIRIPKSIEDHKFHFEALQELYISEEWDKKVKNIGRHCFHSYDPDLYLNEDSTLYTDKAGMENHMMSQAKPLITIKSSNEILQRLDKWFEKHFDASARNNSMYVLANAHNCYGIPENESLSHVLSLFDGMRGTDGSAMKTIEVEQAVRNAYLKTERHGSAGFEDKDVVNITRTKIKQGQDISGVKRQLGDSRPKQEVELIVSEAKSSTESHTFWKIIQSSKGDRIEHLPKAFKDFIHSKGFYRYKVSELNYIFVRVQNNFVEETGPDAIKDCVLGYLEDDFNEVYDYFVNRTSLFKEDFLSFLNTIEIEFIKDGKGYANLFFRNCLLKVNKNSVEELSYIDFVGYVWKDQIIDRDYKASETDCDFKQLLKNVSQKGDVEKELDEDRYNSFRSVIGYLMQDYKLPNFSPCIVFYDEKISDNPEGGTGKGLILEAIDKFKNVCFQDGKKFDPQKDFAYQRVTKGTQVFVIDDAKENLKFEDLFSIVTNGMAVNKKNQDEFFISKYDAPKIAISSNYILKGGGASHERRRFEIELHNYYSKNFTPRDDFGRDLFDGWDLEEWGSFDNFIVDCVQYYLTNGLTEYERVNIAEKRAVKGIGNELIEWISEDVERFINETHKNKVLHDQFMEEVSPDRRFWSQTQFVRKLRAYGKVMVENGVIDEVVVAKFNGVNTTEFLKRSLLIKDECPI